MRRPPLLFRPQQSHDCSLLTSFRRHLLVGLADDCWVLDWRSPCDMSKNACLCHHSQLCKCHPSRHVTTHRPLSSQLCATAKHSSARCLQVLFFRHTISELETLLGNCHTAADAAAAAEGKRPTPAPGAHPSDHNPRHVLTTTCPLFSWHLTCCASVDWLRWLVFRSAEGEQDGSGGERRCRRRAGRPLKTGKRGVVYVF